MLVSWLLVEYLDYEINTNTITNTRTSTNIHTYLFSGSACLIRMSVWPELADLAPAQRHMVAYAFWH